MNAVMDANALIAFLRDEPGADEVERVFQHVHNRVYAHAINLCEVYYDYLRTSGDSAADRAIARLSSVGLIAREDADRPFWQQAGWYKATLCRVSLADCFCITLANRLGAEVVTADHHEFDQVAQQGLCRVRFIG